MLQTNSDPYQISFKDYCLL